MSVKNRKAGRWAAAVALALAAFAGCARLQRQTGPVAEKPAPLVWPASPEPGRIELLQIFGRPSDLGIRRSIWRRLGDILTGSREAHMVRPAGVAAVGQRVAVADAGSGTVHLYDLERRRYLSLRSCGEVALEQPVAVAFLNDRLYVSDSGGGRIAVFDLEGGCTGGWRLANGSRPAGLAADAARALLYVADPRGHQVIAFDPNGAATIRIGRRGEGAGEFNYPAWLALDDAGRLYVTDSLNFRIQVFDPDGRPVASFGRQGDGSGDFARPKGLGIDGDGHIYVVDALFDAVQVFDGEGRYLMVFGVRGTGPGQFWLPSGLAIDGDRIYVADSYNRRVQVFRYLGGPR